MKIRFLSLVLCFLLLAPVFFTACNNSNDAFLADGGNDGETYAGDPNLTFFMSDDNYFDVQNFYLFNKSPKDAGNGEPEYVPVVGFSFIDLAERENTRKVDEPYVFLDEFKVSGYMADSDAIDDCLKQLLSPSFAVVKNVPTANDFVAYGLAREADMAEDCYAEYVIAFNNDITDDNGRYIETVRQRIYFSELTENDTRYAFTEVYKIESDGSVGDKLYDLDMIIEVNAESFGFLEWNRYDWINQDILYCNIAFCREITLDSDAYSAKFTLDNSSSDCTETIHSTYIKVHATDSENNEKTPFSYIDIIDENGNSWVITSNDVVCFSPNGEELTITTADYDNNFLGAEACVLNGYIRCADGTRVYVKADEVIVSNGDDTLTYIRYELSLFRKYYMTLLYSTFSEVCVLSESERSAVTSDENIVLIMNITYTDGKNDLYKFYRLNSSTSYVTINGNGFFCILNSRVDKIISDAQKFFTNQPIAPK